MSMLTREKPTFPLSSLRGTVPAEHQSGSCPGLLLRLWRLFRAWGERRGQRRALAELARLPHLLDDIGLTRAQALREASKPFWR